jgi:hypothetical protein
MNSIHSRRNFTKIGKKIGLCLVFFIANFYHAMQACENLMTTVDILTKSSYTSSEMQKTVLLFTSDNATDTVQELPSVQEIITKVSQLQDQQGFINNDKLRKQAIDALATAIKATNNALSVAKLQHKNQDLEHLLPLTIHDKIIDLLNNQKKVLQKKVGELTKKSIWQHFAQPSTIHVLVALTITTVIITGITLYFDVFNLDASQDSKEPIIFTGGPFNKKREALYAKIRTILTKFIDLNDKQHTTVYLNEAKTLLKELDPIEDHSVIEMINTFIESQNKMDELGPNPNKIKLLLQDPNYWITVNNKEAYYNKILVEILNHDTNRAKTFTPKNIDLMDILSQKNKHNRPI